MENDDALAGAPPPKRARQSHHRAPEYCSCARCNGRVKQKPATLEDHKRRYPRRNDSPAALNDLERPDHGNTPGPAQHRVLGDVTNSPGPARRSPGPQRPPSSPPPSGHAPAPAPAPEQRAGSPNRAPPPRLESPLHFDGDSDGPTPPHSPRRLARSPRHIDPDEDEELPDFEPNEGRDYRFEQYLDNPLQDLGQDEDLGDLMNADLDFGGDGDDPYDADFGLPAGPEEVPNEERPLFQLPLDEDAEPNPDDDPDEEIDPGGGCAAFREPNLIRNAYVDAYVQKALYGATSRATKHQLKAAKRTLSSHPDIHAEDLAKMAQSIGTVERRLGLDTSDIITTFTLCPICGRRYSPADIAGAGDSVCLNNTCAGVLFTDRVLASGARRRVSNLTFPFGSPIAWFRHIFSLSGMAELVQNWRNGEDDNAGLTQPVSSEEWMRNVDMDRPMGDMPDAWGWRSTLAGLERVIDPDTGDVRDHSPLDPPIRFVSLPFGISLTLYTDWFQPTKEKNYSVGACYLIINNLPRHMRFQREYMCLAIMMPGPKEPKGYALDQILEPLINELLELKQGVLMMIRQGEPPVYREQLVHGELSQHIADLIARIKMGGGSGLKSERNFCLSCRSLLSSLSVPAGYMRHEFPFRDPVEDLNNAFFWKTLPTEQERKAFANFTGNRHTALHNLPGWHTTTSSPLDTMHLFYLGGMDWIVKQILVGPGMLTPRYRGAEDPMLIFNACMDRMWLPGNYGRLPPKLGQSNGRIKADQWKLTSCVIFIPLFLALRDGDAIGLGYVPRGTRRSVGGKHQAYRAKLLHEQREKYFANTGRPDLCPPLEQCFPSRSLRFHYRQVLMFCSAINTIDKRTITPNDLIYAQELLQTVCIGYAENNIAMSPNFHCMMHLEESVLKTGSIYNTHVWAMERANGMIVRIRHNGRSKGVLEGTLMRGWWSYTKLQNLIYMFRNLPNRTPSDDAIIEDLLMALRGGPEHAQERGTLMAFIAQCRTEYTRLHGIQDSTRLSNQSRMINLERAGIYDLVVHHCQQVWPEAGIFGDGRVQDLYLAPEGVVRNYSFVEYDGIRYGAHTHTSGMRYSYAYIDGRQPVRVERILHIEFPGDPNMRTICALIRRFQVPEREPEFPWDAWAGRLGVSSWVYDGLDPLEAIPIRRFSGVFALFDVPMSYGHYWVTVALDSVSPELDEVDYE